VLGYLLAIWLLGFPIGGPLCAFLQLKFGSREKWFLSLVLALSAWVFIYGIFDFVLHVPFPDGEIFTRLDLFPE
jgi:MFS family permease